MAVRVQVLRWNCQERLAGMHMELRVLVVAASSGDSGLVLDHLHRAGYHLLSERVDTLAAMDAALGARTWDVIISTYHLPTCGVGDALELVVPHIVANRAHSHPPLCSSSALPQQRPTPVS